MTDAIELAGHLDNANVRAFLWAIRLGEGTQGENGYRTMFTGKLFDSFSDHPRIVNSANGLHSTAAGAYQFLEKTWDGLVKQYGFLDFSPRNQDIACIALILGRKALNDVLDGEIERAVGKCAREWASLPGSPYGQPTVTMERFLKEYREHGGTFAPVLVQYGPEVNNVSDVVNLQGELQEKPMAPFIAAALPAIFEAVPALIRTFGSGSAMSDRNAKAADVLVETAKKAANAVNEQELVEKLKDPTVAANVRSAVEGNWLQIVELGGGIESARAADQKYLDPNHRPFWQAPAFSISALFLAMAGMILVDMLFVHPTGYSENLRTQVITAILGLVAMVGAFWLGTSASSQRKTDERNRVS